MKNIKSVKNVLDVFRARVAGERIKNFGGKKTNKRNYMNFVINYGKRDRQLIN